MTEPAPLVLLVDDDVDCLEVNRQFLEVAGFRVECAFDPSEASAIMDREKPALVVTDLMMKSFDAGFAFAKQIKADPRFGDVPIIVATGVSTHLGFNFRPRNEADLKAMHADAFLPKPVQHTLLVDTVKRLLGR